MLLVAPTGAGKTLAGFLPSLVDLTTSDASGPRKRQLHTLYISPLKALAIDVARNLEMPVREMGLSIRVETRTGDTPAAKRARQIISPPDILLTTPEQLSLLLAHREARALFSGLKRVVLDELHSLVTSKRGDLLSLGLARLRAFAPGLAATGLSATVREPDDLRRYLVAQVGADALPSPSELGPARVPHHEGTNRASPTCERGGVGGGGGAEGAPSIPPPTRRSAGGEPPLAPPSPSELGPARVPQHESTSRAGPTCEGGGVKTEASNPSPAAISEQEHDSASPLADLIVVEGGAAPDIRMLELDTVLPMAGHTAQLSMPAIYDLIRQHTTTLVFVNTRMQAELVFRELWDLNDAGLPIALHHGSLDSQQRRRVEAAMAEGRLKAVVCTSTLDLGIDWGEVDLVVNVGAPKGASRIMQRIGRSNHRMDEPSQAYLVPANRFEILECRAALDAVHEAAQDTPDPREGALDVLAQHVLGCACGEPFEAQALYDEVRSAAPYAWLDWETFEAVVDFVATGGYALRSYERYARILRGPDGLWRVRDARTAQQYRLNVGTIVEATMIKVRLSRISRKSPGTVVPRGGKVLGEIEDSFAETLSAGDTFAFAGEVLRFEGILEDEALVTRASAGSDVKIPSYAGGKFPLSTFLAERVRGILADPFEWDRLPQQVQEMLLQQRRRSLIPERSDLLVETFPRSGRNYLACFPFEGRLAHQTLGMLLTRRLERARLKPLGFVANDYGMAVWGIGDIDARIGRDPAFLDELFGEDMLGDDLDAWMAESALMKRTFRACAIIAGLIERRFPGQEKTRRQMTVSTDLVYDVLRRYEPDHILLRAAWADAATGLLDVRRLGQMLNRIQGRIRHKALDRVSPLAVSLILEIGRERVFGEARDEILAEAEAMLLEEAYS